MNCSPFFFFFTVVYCSPFVRWLDITRDHFLGAQNHHRQLGVASGPRRSTGTPCCHPRRVLPGPGSERGTSSLRWSEPGRPQPWARLCLGLWGARAASLLRMARGARRAEAERSSMIAHARYPRDSGPRAPVEPETADRPKPSVIHPNP